MDVRRSLEQRVGAALGARVVEAAVLGGGDVSEAYRMGLEDGRMVFAKTHRNPPPGFFATEAASLAWLGESGAVRVPSVLAVDDASLVLEWIPEGRRSADAASEAAFGAELAALHAAGRLGEDRLPHLRVARREAEPLGLAQQDLLAHELLERLERELELLGHLGSEPLAERLAVPLFEVAVLALVLVVADATVAHGGRRPAAAPAETGAAEVDEDEGDEDDDDEPENPGEVTQVVTQDLEHGRLPRPGEPGTNAAC